MKTVTEPIHKFIFAIILVLSITSCSQYKYNPKISIQTTTYPQTSREVDVHVPIYSFGIKREGKTKVGKKSSKSNSDSHHEFYYSFKKTIHGDTAVHESYIYDRKKPYASEEYLFKLAQKKGKKICNGKFAILNTNYYFGDEATITLYTDLRGIRSMLAEYRCQIHFTKKELEKHKYLIHFAKKLMWPDFFDIIEYKFDIDSKSLFDAINVSAKAHGIHVIKSGKLGPKKYYYIGSSQLKTPKSEYDSLKRSEQIAAVIEPLGKHSKIKIWQAPSFLYN